MQAVPLKEHQDRVGDELKPYYSRKRASRFTTEIAARFCRDWRKSIWCS